MDISNLEQRFSITEIAAKFSASRQTIYRWLAKYEEGGLEALGDEHRALLNIGPNHCRDK